MKSQASPLRKFLTIAVLGVAALAVILLAQQGSDGDSLAIGETGMDGASTAAMPGRDDFADIDAALGMQTNPSYPGVAADKSAAGGGYAGAPPAAPETASRNSASVPQQIAPDGTSSLIDDRKIVQTASMRLQVKEVGASFEEVGRVATSVGGFVASSSFSNQGESQVASVTIRVPSTRYQEVLSDLRGLGTKVLAEDSRTSDVTAEYTDLTSRLRNLEATETQLLELLGRATTVNEILLVQDRLNNVRSEVEQVKGRMALLTKLTDLATIAVHLAPPAVGSSGGGSGLGNEISEAWDNSIEFLEDLAAGVIHVIVFIWWLPIIAVPAVLIGRSWLRGRPRTLGTVD